MLHALTTSPSLFVSHRSTKPPSRPSRRAAAAKKTKYIDSSTDDETDSETEEANDPKKMATAGKKKKAPTAIATTKAGKKTPLTNKTGGKTKKNATRLDDVTPDVNAIRKTVYKQPEAGDWRVMSVVDY